MIYVFDYVFVTDFVQTSKKKSYAGSRSFFSYQRQLWQTPTFDTVVRGSGKLGMRHGKFVYMVRVRIR